MSERHEFIGMSGEELERAVGGRRVDEVNIVQATNLGYAGGYGMGYPAMAGGVAPPVMPYSTYTPYSPSYGGYGYGYGGYGGMPGYGMPGYGFPGYGMRLGTAI